MNLRELQFLQEHFRQYYHGRQVAPPDVTAREFGFGWQKKIDYRHAAFSSNREFTEFIVGDVPLFVSYSTAYYQFPSKRPVPKKGYLGSDLVFDLDKTNQEHDHRPFFCRACLDLIHGEALMLKKLLKEDFGFESILVFSGQKGFHLHVRSSEVRNLRKEARRQLADYAGGEGLDPETLFPTGKTEVDSRQSRAGSFRGPDSNSQGWPGRVHALLRDAVEKKDPLRLRLLGLSKKNIEYVVNFPEEAIKNLDAGNWNAFCDKPPLKALEAVRFVQTDKAVTFDLSRLIRLPESLHGSTGFVAKRLADDGFKIEDAVAFAEAPMVEVKPLESVEFQLFKPYSLQANRLEGVPLNVAIFLVAQGKAVLP